MSEQNIIRIQDLLESRELKRNELIFYNAQLCELGVRLSIIQNEIAITKFIIGAIEREQIIDLAEFHK